MTITYQYKDLNSVADWYWNRAIELRNQITPNATGRQAKQNKEKQIEASCYEHVAWHLRSTVLVGDQK